MLQLPDELWRLVIRSATMPEAHTHRLPTEMDMDEFDRFSLPAEPQERFPWRRNFKHPGDTKTSLDTKVSLMAVSHKFHSLTSEFLYESIYVHGNTESSLTHLRDLLMPAPSNARLNANASAWVKQIHILISEHTPRTDAWISLLKSIIRLSTSLHGIFIDFVLDEDHLRPFWQAQTGEILAAILACITHFEWSDTRSYMRGDTSFPPASMADLFRRAVRLQAIRLSTFEVTLPLADGLDLPHLQYLDLDTFRNNIDWPRFSALRCIAFNGNRGRPIPLLPGAVTSTTLPRLSYMWFNESSLKPTPSQLRDMLRATPNLQTIVYSASFPITEANTHLWSAATADQCPSLQRVELHFNDTFAPGDFSFTPLDLDVVFARLALHVSPLADAQRFANLTDFALRGLRHGRGRFAGEERFHEVAGAALEEVVARGVRVVMED